VTARPRAVLRPGDDHPAAATGVLVGPASLVVARAGVDRLARSLADAPADVVGVVAPRQPLPPGASVTVHAERLALDAAAPGSDARTDQPVVGVALVRPGVTTSIDETGAIVADGALLVDHGAAAHAPDDPPAPLAPADPRSRPPFSWRPVVVVVGLQPEPPDVARWSELVDALVESDVDARLAVSSPPPRVGLAGPCQPGPDSHQVLRPDLVIALDAPSLAAVAAWPSARRTTLVVVDPQLADAVELVPWAVGQAQGRLRARMGPAAPVVAVRDLVHRLSAGPVPAPPLDLEPDLSRDAGPRVVVPLPRRIGAPPRPDVRLVVPPGAPHRRLDGLVAHLAEVGDVEVVEHAGPDGGSTTGGWIVELGDDNGAPAAESRLALARTVGRAVTADAELAGQLRADGVRTLVVPPRLAPVEVEGLIDASEDRPVPATTVVGWILRAPSSSDRSPAASAGLRVALDRDDRLEVEVMVDVGVEIAGELTDHPRVRRRARPPDPGELARWAALVVDDPASPLAQLDAARAGLAGVPVVACDRDRDGDANAWAAAVHDAVARPADASRRARAHAIARHGSDAGASTARRLVGWLAHEDRR
jgi:hypothetical protein